MALNPRKVIAAFRARGHDKLYTPYHGIESRATVRIGPQSATEVACEKGGSPYRRASLPSRAARYRNR